MSSLEPSVERQVLDIYSPADAKNLPVVFWIHGGGWQVGDKSDVNVKPQAFMDRGFVFGLDELSPAAACRQNSGSRRCKVLWLGTQTYCGLRW